MRSKGMEMKRRARAKGSATMLAPMVWLVLLAALPLARATVEVMKDVTLGFGDALQHCREESQLTEEQMEEFFHFWREDFLFEHRALGCAIRCMSRHFDLLTDSHRMHHDNTEKFIHSFPNGEKLARQMIEIIHGCEQQFDSQPDHCWRILRVAECFKQTSVARGIAPTMEMLLAEFILESEP